ncbi:MAG: AAA family ATPase, partial [Plesiomonas shigelloides]
MTADQIQQFLSVHPEELRPTLKALFHMTAGAVQPILFVGSTGVGKSTLMDALARHYAGDDFYHYTATDRRAKDYVSDVQDYCRMQSLAGMMDDVQTGKGERVVILDEIDRLSANGTTLRPVLDKHGANILFLAACNSTEHLCASVIDRFFVIEWPEPEPETVSL